MHIKDMSISYLADLKMYSTVLQKLRVAALQLETRRCRFVVALNELPCLHLDAATLYESNTVGEFISFF